MLIINVGKKGSGKTTRTKEILKNLLDEQKKIILDVNDEYSDIDNSIICTSFDEIILETKKNNNFFVFEEATIFFSHHVKISFFDFLVKQRHQNNDFIFNFHSLRTVPLYLFDFADFIMLGKTNDLKDFVSSKFNGSKLVLIFEQVEKNENDFFSINFKI